MTKNKILTLGFVTSTILTGQAATITWGGAGSAGAAEFWNLAGTGTGQNGDPTHWGQATPPVIDGTDDIIMAGGGIKKDSGLDFMSGSDLTMNSSAYFRINSTGVLRVRSGALVTVNTGSIFEITTGYFNATGGTINIAGGTLHSTGAQTNAIRATTGLGSGGFDFTALGGNILIDNHTGTDDLVDYLDNKRATGFFKINGTVVSGFGAAHQVGGQFIEYSGTTTAGSLTLVAVPEPSSTALLGLGGLTLILRRRR